MVSMLVEGQDAGGSPKVEDKNRVERLVRLDGEDTFLLGSAICYAVCSHVV
jgi:hypothetical protein